MQKLFSLVIFGLLLYPTFSSAQVEVFQDVKATWRAEVREILSEEREIIPGTDTPATVQNLRVEILDGERAGQFVEFKNDYISLKEGEKFFLSYIQTINGDEFYSVLEPDRRGFLLILGIIFVFLTILFAGFLGVRALISLGLSIFLIVYLLLPGILNGWLNPVLLSVIFGSVILTLAMYITHGLYRKTTIALLSTIGAITLTGFLAAISVSLARLSGFVSDEAVILNFTTRGALDLSGLLLGAIIIGVLGVLDDIAITQVSAVEELRESAPHISKKNLFQSAMRIGKDHVAALLNTLFFAYIGASLPLLVLFSLSETSTLLLLNREVFATEIVRTLVGSIGLILTVPLATIGAVYFGKRGS